MKHLLLIFLLASSLLVSAQSRDKRQRLDSMLTGTWVFAEGYQKDNKSVNMPAAPMSPITIRADHTAEYEFIHSGRGTVTVYATWKTLDKNKVIVFQNVAGQNGGYRYPDTQYPYTIKNDTLKFEFVMTPTPNWDASKNTQDITFVFDYVRQK